MQTELLRETQIPQAITYILEYQQEHSFLDSATQEKAPPSQQNN